MNILSLVMVIKFHFFRYMHSYFPSPFPPLHLNNILYSYHIVKNLIYVHHLSIENNIPIELDPLLWKLTLRGHPLKMQKLSWSLSPVDVNTSTNSHSINFSTILSALWHYHLGHLGTSSFSFSYTHMKQSSTCQSYIFGKHIKLPFLVWYNGIFSFWYSS